MNKCNVMFIRPKSCHYCDNGFYALRYVVDYAKSKLFNVVNLEQAQADNPFIDDTVNSFNPYLIYGDGHGSNMCYTANSETPVWIVGEDLTHLSGRIIYLLSCLTANQLGPYLIQQGVLAYGGFLISWTWIASDTSGDPYEDTYGECFYKSANKFFESLLDGNPISQAEIDSIAEYDYWIDYWADSGDTNATEIIKWLIHDKDGLVIYGNPSAHTSKCELVTSYEFTVNTK